MNSGVLVHVIRIVHCESVNVVLVNVDIVCQVQLIVGKNKEVNI